MNKKKEVLPLRGAPQVPVSVTTPSNYQVALHSNFPCHVGNVLVFEWQGVHFYGGGSSHGACLPALPNWIGIDLRLSGASITQEIAWENFEPSPALALWKGKPRVIHLPVPDQTEPLFPKELWLALLEDLRARAPVNVLVFCLGGHGRTGTVLAVLAGLAGITKTDPINFVRKHYCKEAVESEAQRKYIQAITGLAVKEAVGFTYQKGGAATGVIREFGEGYRSLEFGKKYFEEGI